MNINDTFLFQNVGLPEDIRRRKEHGDFAGAIRLIDLRLKETNLSQALRACLQVHREMLLRLPVEFPYTREEAISVIRQYIADFPEETFDEYVDQRKIRWIYIDGQMRIFDRFFSTLCKADPAFAKRAGIQPAGVETTSGHKGPGLLDMTIRKMKDQGSLTYRIRVRAAMKLKDEQFTPGMFIRAHLPIPSACQQQSDIRIEKVFPETGMIAPVDAPQRTVCWEENMTDNHEFEVVYSYLHTAKYTDAYHLCGTVSGYSEYTDEQMPHISFTPYIRRLCAELTDGLTDPLAKARAIYDFITLNMKYTFMPDYFVLENIAENCALSYNGDCGVFALLFITLCRCAGIPAQWQSGLTAEPDFIGCHDWTRFYAEPYGWLFADPSYGIAAVRAGNEDRRQFYFGNLDPYRMVANSEFQVPFTVPKEHWRSDPYDNQSGEMETSEKCFRDNEFVRSKEVLLCEEV